MKITKRQQYWLEIIKKQGGIYKSYSINGLPQFRIINCENQPSEGLIERLINKGALLPAGDGLFGDSQTYKTLES